MKKIFNSIKKKLLFCIIMLLIVLIVSHFILSLLNIRYRQWVYWFISLLFIIAIVMGIIIGIVQLVRKKGKIAKIISIIVSTLIIVIVLSYCSTFLLILAFLYCPEHIITKDDKKYVAYVNSFLKVNVNYYDYINFFLVGNKVKIHEYYGNGGYDPFESKHSGSTPQVIEYYNDNGELIEKVINNNTEKVEKDKPILDSNTENNDTTKPKNKTYIEVLYEKRIDDNTSIKIVRIDYVLAQRSLISVEKTTDGGKNFENQSDVIQINNGAKFVFINENIGFINNPGLAGTNGNNRTLLVTIDGGKNFKETIIIANDSIENLYIDDVPYIEDNILKFKAYIIKNSEKEYYYFSSKDNGLTWSIYDCEF